MSKRLTQEEVLERFVKIHGSKYDYSKVRFVNVDEKVCIICPEHGEFWQTPYKHINRKQGCPKCGHLRTDNFKRRTLEEVVKLAKETHKNMYDYSLIKEYKNSKEKVPIICSKHGVFFQSFEKHILQKEKCPRCSRKLTTEEFIKKAKEIHGNKYDYSLVDYNGSEKNIKIICSKHGVFEQTPHQHLKRSGCQKCLASRGENKIRDFLSKENIVFEEQKRFNGFKKYPYDFFIPSENLLIEYNGEQHYEPVEYFGGVNQLTKQQNNDKVKEKYARDNGYKLLTIPYWDYKIIEEILEKEIC